MVGNLPSVYYKEDTGLKYGFDIDIMLPEYTINQYTNMECNNCSRYPLMNGKMSPSNNQPVSTFITPSVTSINDEVCSLQNPIQEKINY